MPIESPYAASETIRGLRWLNEPTLYPDSHGDVWSCAWADDGHIYSVADDTQGIGRNCNSNLAIYRVTGTPPDHTVALVPGRRPSDVDDGGREFQPGARRAVQLRAPRSEAGARRMRSEAIAAKAA